MKSPLLLILAIFLNTWQTFAQVDYDEKFYQNFISGDMDQWVVHLDELKKDYNKTQNPKLIKTLVKAQYGLIAYFIGSKEKSKASDELELAENYLDKLISIFPNDKKYLAYKGAYLGFAMGISPWKLFYLGPQSQEYILEAFSNSPETYQANFEYANMLFWAPSFVGGDKEKSLTYYRKTILLLEQRHQTRDWYYLWAYTALANAVKEVEGFEKAKILYDEILRIEPNFKWIEDELLKTNKIFPDLNL